jgi:hypothetical protein
LRIKYGCTRQKGRLTIYWSRPSGGLYVTAQRHQPLVKIVQYCTDLLKADSPKNGGNEPLFGDPAVFVAGRSSSNLRLRRMRTLSQWSAPGTAFLGSVQ